MNFYSRSRVPLIAAMAIAAVVFGAVHASAQSTPGQVKSSVSIQIVRNVDEPGFNVYQHSQNITIGPVSATAFFPILTNRVVVVEHVSLSGGLQGGGVVQAFVRCSTTSDATQEVDHSLVLVPQGTNESNGFTFYSASQAIKCFAAAPGSLSVHVQTGTIQAAQPIWVMAVSGYTVPQ